MRRLSSALLLLAFSTPALAQHNARYAPTGRATTTSVSGTASPYAIGQLRHFGADVVYSLTLWDSAHGVCAAEATGWTARRGFPSSIATSWRFTDRFEQLRESLGGRSRVVVDCSGAKVSETVEAPFPTGPATPTSTGIRLRGHNGAAAISGVRVCTDGTPDGPVRGLAVFTSTLNALGNGRIERSGTETVEFEGCAQWQKAQRCPAGTVATGVDLHYAGATGSNDHLTGVALSCQAIEITPLDD